MSDANLNNDLDLDGGKRRSKKHPRPKSGPIRSRKNAKTIIVGKIYANWCGHCQALKPEWAKMRKLIKRKDRGKKIQFVEIEESQMADKLPKFQQKHNVKVEANGFPSLFRLANGKVDYYQGNRSAYPMAEWFLRGGDPLPSADLQQQIELAAPMPRLVEDLQGGRRHPPTRRGYKGKHFDPNYHSKKQYYKNKTHNKNDSGGLLSFLFGK